LFTHPVVYSIAQVKIKGLHLIINLVSSLPTSPYRGGMAGASGGGEDMYMAVCVHERLENGRIESVFALYTRMMDGAYLTTSVCELFFESS